MDKVFAYWLIVAALVLGAWMGVSAVNDGWMNDCQATGMHREQSAVYKCERVN